MDVISRKQMTALSATAYAVVVVVGGLIIRPLSPGMFDLPEPMALGESIGFMCFWSALGLVSIPWRARRLARSFTFTFAEEGAGYFVSQVVLACALGPIVWIGILRSFLDS